MEGTEVSMVTDAGTNAEGEIDGLIRACGQGKGLQQQEARLALENMGAAAVGAIVQALLHSEDSIIRWRSAEALGHIGDVRAIQPLIQALGDRNTAVQWRSIEALADIGEPALSSLYLAADDDNVDIRWGAKRAIKEIISKRDEEAKEKYYAEVNEINESLNDTADDGREDVASARTMLCSVCNRHPAVNYGYCIECSGRRGYC